MENLSMKHKSQKLHNSRQMASMTTSEVGDTNTMEALH